MPKSETIAFADLETTGLVEAHGTSLDLQPYVTEVCIIKTDNKFNIIDKVSTLVKPPISIPDFLVKRIGISNEMVEKSPTFAKVARDVKKILKADIMVAQNLRFDKDIIQFEFDRISRKVKFPPTLFCTVEQSMFFQGFRLKSTELHELATKGKEFKNLHRAEGDVLAMIEYYKFILKYQPEHFKELL